jgi:hypothetical protein
MQAIGSFLQLAPTPTTLLGNITALETRVADMQGALAKLQAGLTSFNDNMTIPVW